MTLRKYGAALALAMLALSVAQAKEKKDERVKEYNAPYATVYREAVRTVGSNWHLTFADKDTGTISFTTGRNWRTSKGFDMSVVITDVGDGKTEVAIHPQRRASGQVFSWHEGDRITKHFFELLDEALAKDK